MIDLRSKRNRTRKALERGFVSLVEVDSGAQKVSLRVPSLNAVFGIRASGARPFVVPEDHLVSDVAFTAADHVMKSGREKQVLEALVV